jgi:chromosome segregation ATPase
MTENSTASSAGHGNSHHWLGVFGVTAVIVLAAAIFTGWLRARRLQANHQAQLSRLEGAASQNRALQEDGKSIRDLLQRFDGQKDELVREIADFRRELDLLQARTKSIEQTRDQLQKLDGALADFQKDQGRFEDNLRSLEAAVQKSR